MIWINQFFFYVLVTSATGSVMLAIWSFCRILFTKWNPNLIYNMLRWVVLMFLLPFTYMAIALNYEDGYIQQGNSLQRMLFIINMSEFLFQGLAVVWFMVTTIITGFFLLELYKKWRLCKDNFDDGDSLAQTEFKRIKEVLGIKGKVTLLRNCNLKNKSPFAIGIFRRRVVLPYMDYTEEELKIILYHELSHIKKRDIVFRYLTTIAILLNSINPISYVLLLLVTHWSEAECDIRAVEGLEKEGISAKVYANTILRLMSGNLKKQELFTMTMLHGAAKSLYGRIEFMEIYRKNMRKVAKPVTMALVMMFMLLSSVTAYAAGIELAEVNDRYLKETQVKVEDRVFEENVGWGEITYISPEDANVPNIVYINDGVMMLGEGTIDWDVPAGTRYVTGGIYLKKDTVVNIATSASPSNVTYWIGLMYPSSAIAIAEGTGTGHASFTVPSTGYYRVLVENRSATQTLSVVGGYTY